MVCVGHSLEGQEIARCACRSELAMDTDGVAEEEVTSSRDEERRG